MNTRDWLHRHDTTRVPYACPHLDAVIKRIEGSSHPDAVVMCRELEAVRAIVSELRARNHDAAEVLRTVGG